VVGSWGVAVEVFGEVAVESLVVEEVCGEMEWSL
jgi:hypothetical protein